MFYSSIADVYDYIFPQNKKQVEFIEKISPIAENENILEIGCATGNLTQLLYQKAPKTIGIDLDKTLLEKGKEKYPKIMFLHKNMLAIEEEFNKNTMDKVISFGNTLVHLPNREKVKEFFKSVYAILKEDGIFIVQIIHYDRILNQNIQKLSTIENEHIKFTRKYVLQKNKVDFHTSLQIHSTGENIQNVIPLLAIRKEELKKYLEEAGFKDIFFYGDLLGKTIGENDVPLLFSCKK